MTLTKNSHRSPFRAAWPSARRMHAGGSNPATRCGWRPAVTVMARI